jgi:hypothetical protein
LLRTASSWVDIPAAYAGIHFTRSARVVVLASTMGLPADRRSDFPEHNPFKKAYLELAIVTEIDGSQHVDDPTPLPAGLPAGRRFRYVLESHRYALSPKPVSRLQNPLQLRPSRSAWNGRLIFCCWKDDELNTESQDDS